MNSYQTTAGKTCSYSLGATDKAIRTVVGFGALLVILTGVATTSIQIFVLSCLGIYLIHTVIIGIDPFYVAARKLRSALAHNVGNLPTSPAGAH